MPTLRPLPTLVDGDLVLRPAVSADAPRLLDLLRHPTVAAWWGDNTLESITEELAGHLAIEVDGVLSGLIECHEETDETYPSVAFDIFLDPALHGRRLGRRALRLTIDHCVESGHHRFTIDPAVSNAVAIASYRAVGFQPVGILRASERAPDGRWRDALLMDLLSWELPDAIESPAN